MPFLAHRLPDYSGQYNVGTTDVEVPADVPRTFGSAQFQKTKEPALVLETVLMTIYYPTDLCPAAAGHQRWLEKPLKRSVKGYSKGAEMPLWLILPLFQIYGGSTTLPATIDTALSDRIGAASGREDDVSDASTVVDGEGEDDPTSFPLVMFSHGLSGNRTTYSQYCGEFASHGYIVVALEHRDGSGPATVSYKSPGKRCRKIKYVTPSDLFYPDPKQTDIDFRREQVDMRIAEIEMALDLIKMINKGNGEEVSRRNVRSSKIDWRGWKGRIGMNQAVMAGHSFGGATTLQLLRVGKSFPFKRGIVLDPWIDPLSPLATFAVESSPDGEVTGTGDPPEKVGRDIETPLLIINSEAFTLWHQHYVEVRKIAEQVPESWLMTLVGSVHISFSDFPLVAPFLAKKMGSRIDGSRALLTFVFASLEFLSGTGTRGPFLRQKVIPGDEAGLRHGEGHTDGLALAGGKPMDKIGQMRMHVVPK